MPRLIPDGIPGAEMAIIPKAGHHAVAEAGETMAAEIREFLERGVEGAP